jgi:hypothetical protein
MLPTAALACVRLLVAAVMAALLLVGAPQALPVRAQPAIAPPFVDYYARHAGMRLLGAPLTGLVMADGVPAQYFDKGRLEDHRQTATDPVWAFQYGRLTVELMEHDPDGSVTDTATTYRALREQAAPRYRHPPPPDAADGVAPTPLGVFVPYDARLQRAPGYYVPAVFWGYINRADLFPAGWLHDIGLPLTDPFEVETVKQGERRRITLQAFERSVLTYDPLNPVEWQVERGNIGADAVRGHLDRPTPIQVPAAQARVTLPLFILARVGAPGQRITAVLRWQNGVERTHGFTALRGEDGRGLVIGTTPWWPDVPPQPPTQPASVRLYGPDQRLLAEQHVLVLAPSDSDVTTVQLFWVQPATETVQAQIRHLDRTPRPATAALEALLWGPPPATQIGYQTAIPTPEQVLGYPGRGADWGPRVTLRGLEVENGVATADFSRELHAYGGGSLRVRLIREQISQTLLQFSSIRTVRIAIEGQTEAVLEP